MLKIFNIFTKKKEIFIPINMYCVSIYICGITVYNKCHIGHARMFIFFDIVIKYLNFLKFKVYVVRNITDIDDKIVINAFNENKNIYDYTNKYINLMNEDLNILSINPTSFSPLATSFVRYMICIIEKLLKMNYAYIINGDVYYDVSKNVNYGKLSNINLNSIKLGFRIKKNTLKKHYLDFVLWKKSKKNEPFWNSPFGCGRPGWHTECSAMSMYYYGSKFDIHGGGKDLIFPHHENECAQSEVILGQNPANFWIHVGVLNYNNIKMSKSYNNYISINDFVFNYGSEVLVIFFLSTHYRLSINYCIENIDIINKKLKNIYISLYGLQELFIDINFIRSSVFFFDFVEAMNDDFNTPKALTILYKLSKIINSIKSISIYKASRYGLILKYLFNILGLTLKNNIKEIKNNFKLIYSDNYINYLVFKRNILRINKFWVKADIIRYELIKHGITIEDHYSKSIWKKKY